MSIFEYQDFQDWEGFSALNASLLRLSGSLGNIEQTRSHFAGVPPELKGQSLAYALEYAVNSLSPKRLAFADELGALDLITPQSSLEVALRLRDAFFTKKDFQDGGHVELLAKLAADHGEAFAVDTMHAAFNSDMIEQRLGLKSFPSAQEKADGFSRNLKLMERFIEPHVLTSSKLGNIAFRHMAVQERSTSGDADFSECVDFLSRMEATDLKAVIKVLHNDTFERHTLLSRHVDHAIRHNFNELLHTENEGVIFEAMKVKPISVMTSLLMISQSDLTAFISGTGLSRYADGHWTNGRNLEEIVNAITLFNERLEANPYFISNAKKPGGIYKPSSPGIPFLLLAPVLKRNGVYVDLSSKYAGNKQLESFSKAIGKLREIGGMDEYVRVAVDILTDNMAIRLASAYRTFSSDKIFGKDIRPRQDAENPDGVGRDYQIRFAAVRICAEMHQQTDKKNVTWEKKHTPFQYLAGKIHKDIDCKEALLELVKSYDEETILDALVSYKPGIMPLIELGVLDRKHMNKLTMKERGKVLEADLGM